jgi:transcriptional regulator with XRE-family HTH domain
MIESFSEGGNIMNTLGTRLRSARERKRLSQVDVFKRTGINNKTLSRYENNGTEPDADSLRKLAEIYEISVDWLLGRNTINDQARNDAIEAYNRLPPSKKKLVDDIIKELSDEKKKL